MSTVSTVSTMSTRVFRHCYQASTNQLLSHYDVYNIYSLYSLYKDFQGLLMWSSWFDSIFGAFTSFFFLTICCRRCWGSWCYGWLSIDLTFTSFCLYFVFKDIAPIVRSCRSYNVPQIFWCVPHDFTPALVDVVEFDWVILQWSYRDIDEIPCASLDGSPPSFFDIMRGTLHSPRLSIVYGVKAQCSQVVRHTTMRSLVLMLCCHWTSALTWAKEQCAIHNLAML